MIDFERETFPDYRKSFKFISTNSFTPAGSEALHKVKATSDVYKILQRQQRRGKLVIVKIGPVPYPSAIFYQICIPIGHIRKTIKYI